MERRFTSLPRKSLRRGSAAFTLLEVTFAGCLLAVFIAGSVIAMTQINRWATAARLRTLALAIAQQRIDQVLTTPWQIENMRPTILNTGTATENNLPLNNDAFNSASGLFSAFTALDTQVNLTRTTQVTDLTTRTLRATVAVTFSYRNKPSTVTLTTLRATDSI